MHCFPCFTSQKSKKSQSMREHGSSPQENVVTRTPLGMLDMKKPRPEDANQVDTSNIQAKHFTFRELATATKNFRQECLLGEGGFGRVYKGTIPATGQVVAVKQLDRSGMQGSKEFLIEVLMLSLLNHENLVKLIGYCADGDQRLLVHEFVPGGSLENRLLGTGPDQPPLDWFTRMKIASSAAQGLEYLHDSANPPVIYRDLKSSNILLDNDMNAKLNDYGLAKLAGGDKMNQMPGTRVMGTYGYCAPEYVRTGNLTLKSDVYSFGVLLLELITGRRVIDTTKPNHEQNLVQWAQPIFRDPKRFPDMADPLLKKQFPEKDLNQAVAIAAMCLQEEAGARPLMSDVVVALSFLSTEPTAVPSAAFASHKSESESESEEETGKNSHHSGDSDSSNEEGSYHDHEGNETASNQVADSAKYQEGSPEDIVETNKFYSKSSRKSSTRSGNGSSSSDSEEEDGSVSSTSRKSSRKSHGVNGNLSQKSSKEKSSVKDLSQKSSKKKSSMKDLSQKSSKKSKSNRKSSVEVLSHKTSKGSDGSVSLSRNSSSGSSDSGGSSMVSQANVSFGSDHYSSRRSEEEGSMQLDHTSSRGSENVHHFDHTSSRGSEGGSFYLFEHTSSRGSDEGSFHS